jgi:hypothetical protein
MTLRSVLAWIVVATLLGPAEVALAAAPRYAPPAEPEPGTPPKAYFGKDVGSGRWCAMAGDAFERRSAAGEIDAEEVGWIRYSGGGFQSVTVQLQSEDALATDRYAFDRDGRVVPLVRTGGYIESPPASLVFAPDASGRLAPNARSRAVLRRMDEADYDHYIEHWPAYGRFQDLPFAGLIEIADGVRVRFGCIGG